MRLGLTYKNEEHIFDENVVNGVPYLSYPLLEETGAVKHGFSTKLGGVSTGSCATTVSYTHLDVYKRQVVKAAAAKEDKKVIVDIMD